MAVIAVSQLVEFFLFKDPVVVFLSNSVTGRVSTALINLAVGIAIGTLLSAALSRTVSDAERSWQRR